MCSSDLGTDPVGPPRQQDDVLTHDVAHHRSNQDRVVELVQVRDLERRRARVVGVHPAQRLDRGRPVVLDVGSDEGEEVHGAHASRRR